MAMISQAVMMFVAAVLIGGYALQGPANERSTNALSHGEKLFVAHCALCHGIGGTGGRGPALNHPELRSASTDQALFRIIQNGIEGTEMPGAWQLTDREINQLAGYVKSLGRTAIVKLPGDTAKGKQLYDSKGGCAACHIASGRGGNMGPDLSDIGARRSANYLREALLDPGAAVPDGFMVVSATTRDGKKVRGVRSNEDSFTIQLRDASNTFHSFRKNQLTELKKELGTSLMPGYRDVLAASEIDDLVAYLAGLRGAK
jgi:putative heme-binding domain-containing protein